ncbi:MAG: hypothetical protein JNK40_06590 [Chromatiales bacterium]|nr:hypothetical protein [Chromatiales bacterium]
MAAPLVAARLAITALLVALPAAQATAVELALESVTATTGSGEVKLRLSSRATFDFDPALGVLVASGTWIAEYALPNQLTRIGHKVEDLRATADGQLAMKSYECVEGAFGAAFMQANICGNYRFGPNGIDEGGLADDEVLGPPRSLAGYGIGGFDWDGATLVLTLVADAAGESGIFPEPGFSLRLVAMPAP